MLANRRATPTNVRESALRADAIGKVQPVNFGAELTLIVTAFIAGLHAAAFAPLYAKNAKKAMNRVRDIRPAIVFFQPEED
jgi:hypothetical protein